MAKSYTAQLQDARRMTNQGLRYVAASAIQDTIEDAMETVAGVSRGAAFVEGKLPVNLGELVGSLSTNGGAPSEDSYVLAIADFDVGDVMSFAWTAPHARRIEEGFSGEDSLGRRYEQPGRHFVGSAAVRFPDHVRKRASEVS